MRYTQLLSIFKVQGIKSELKNQTSVAGINSWDDSFNFANVAYSLWNTLLTYAKVFWSSYSSYIIGPKPKNQTIASINSGVDSLDFENVAHSLWNTLLTHLKVFCPSYGPLINGPEPENQNSNACIISWHDSLGFENAQQFLEHLTVQYQVVSW